MTYHSLIVEKKKKYAVIKLNRPHEMNAISKEMHRELYDVFTDLETDSDVRAVVLTGGEYVFSAGMDIKEMSNLPDKENDEFLKSMMKYLKKIYFYIPILRMT